MRLQVGLTVFVSIFLSAPVVRAQGTTATIYGAVADSSGAVAPNVTVTVTNRDTNFSRNAATGPDGQYQFQFLPIGTYKMEASAAGFKNFEQTGIVLDVNRNARVDIVLQLGPVSETIVNLSNPGTSINSSQNVGRIASAGPMRQAQLGLKLTF